MGMFCFDFSFIQHVAPLSLQWPLTQLFTAAWAGSVDHRYQKSQNRLLKVCCVPATGTGLPRVSFLFFLLQWPFTVLIKQTRQAVRAVKQSIYS